MTIQTLQNLFATKQLKKGKFYKMITEKTENGLTKTTETTIRFVNYYKKKSTIAKGSIPSGTPNPNRQVIIADVCYLNTKTGNYLLQVNTIPNGHTISTFKDQNGNPIDRATYESVNPSKKGNPTDYYTISLDRVVSIK